MFSKKDNKIVKSQKIELLTNSINVLNSQISSAQTLKNTIDKTIQRNEKKVQEITKKIENLKNEKL
jgi:hypothetical protein